MATLPRNLAKMAADHQRAILELADDGGLIANLDTRPALKKAIAAAAPGSYRQNKLKIALILAEVAAKTATAWSVEALNAAVPSAIMAANLDGLAELEAWAAENSAALPPVAVRPAVRVLTDALLDRVPDALSGYEAAVKGRVRRTIASGFLDTVSTIDDVVARVDDDLKAERWRAERLVRTEVLNAYNLSKHEMLREAKLSGLAPDVKKTCVVTQDNRTARDSFALIGQVRTLGDPFVDGAGRAYQHPPGRPNDREVEVPWLPDFTPPATAPAELLDGTPAEHAEEVKGAVSKVLGDLADDLGLEADTAPAPLDDDVAAKVKAATEALEAAREAERIANERLAAAREAERIANERLAAAQAALAALTPPDDQPAAPSAPALSGWPDDPDALEVVRQLGGSTGAELVRGPDGALYVRKRGNSPGHLEEEATADAAYTALGVPVPDFRLYRDTSGQARAKLSRFIEGRTLAELATNDRAAYDAARARLAENFHIDALLGNWDVAGLGLDNVLVGADGTPYRIDNGGALRYRAQGALKRPELWSSGGCLDFWTMRDKAINPSAAKVFEGLVNFDAALEAVADLDFEEDDDGGGPLFGNWGRDDGVSLPDEVRVVLRQRLNDLTHAHNQNAFMRLDDVRQPYRERVTREVQRLRASGISQRLPKSLMPRLKNGQPDPERVLDENGDNFDKLRGSNGLIESLKQHIDNNDGDWQAVKKYTQAQGGSSWSGQSLALKYWWNTRVVDRGNPETAYYWGKNTFDTAEAAFNNVIRPLANNEETYSQGMAIFHAMALEILDKVDLPGATKNGDGTFNLIRTEADFIPQTYFPKAKVGDVIPPYQRGAMESTSAFAPTYAYSSSRHKMVFLNVPAHRILGTYLMGWGEKYGVNEATYLSDDENEFTADLYGVSARWEADERP